MRNRWVRLLGVLGLVGLLAAGCGDDDSGGDDADGEATEETTAPTTTTEAAVTTTTEAASAAGDFGCAPEGRECDGSVTPAEGLADGDEVTIEASGFEPNASLGVTQCIDDADPDHGVDTTGAEVCNLRAVQPVVADAQGNVSVTYAVAAGQTMVQNTQAGVTCDATHDCVVSVGELIPDPDAQRITFTLKFA